MFPLIVLLLASAPAFAVDTDDRKAAAWKPDPEVRDFASLEEAEEYLEDLKKERDLLEGDFFGLNITAYRYTNVFFTPEYIRYRIAWVDAEIRRTQEAVSSLKTGI